ncbi:YIP1 family protein [Butyrivibrio sp. YAB3001]|uniref:YIP1 family protein n=1 Tax=Butyrivibrio sp. YAB3001 TaxID=1520812 RepID=UPI0008F647B1|nr:YIP1 family protein [Butyrivibrio sp. YAB3001]SFB74948.1 Sugar lactone lactonase YvrE [Butyrivibrio sp. YAB3001]
MKKKLIKVIAAIAASAVIAIGITEITAKADAPYKTYTVDGYGAACETQTAYLPYETITKIGDETLNAPTDFTLLDDGTMYILDSGNARVVVSDLEGNLVRTFGEGILVAPRGIYVTKEHVTYVADRDAKSIFVFDENGKLQNTYGRPDVPMYGETQDFLPLKIIVNEAGTMYVICESNTNGVVEISPVEDGTFLGYFGTNMTNSSLINIIWRAVLTDAQRAKMRSNIPSTPDNMAIDDKGIIYTVTRGEGEGTVKRLNIAGVNMLKASDYDTVPAAIATGNHDNCFVVSQQGFIYEYNNEGELLFVFGGKDDGQLRIGLSTKAEAIQVGTDDKIYVLDSDKAQIQIYEPTEFTNYLHNALYLFSKGRYKESKTPLLEVLEMNNLFDYANKAMGKALYKEEDYNGALHYAKLSKDLDTYSDAFWEIRNNWLRKNLSAIVIIIICLLILKFLVKKLDEKKKILDGPRKVIGRFKEKKLSKELGYMFYFIRHPIDGCYGIKWENRVSVLSSNIILLAVIVLYIINKYFCGFLFKTVREGSFDVVSDIGMIIIALLLVVGCNYLMCTINDGEGRFKHIYCSFIYSFSPFVIIMPFIILLSHVVTYNEQFFVTFGRFCMIVWIAVLLVISIREINQYTVGETAKIIFLTVFTILIVCLIAFILYVLWAQVFDFLQSVVREVVYKIGS